MITLIPLDRILPAERNARKTFTGIEELAESIHQIGMLQNLVVDGGRQINSKSYYVLMAGERRFRALELLTKQGRAWNALPETGVTQVPCLVSSMDFDWVNLAENLGRQELPLWQAGHRYCELSDAGFTQQQIALKLQIPISRVSRHSIIARNLCPQVAAQLDKTRGYEWKEIDLFKLANLVNRHQEPDVDAQLAFFAKLLEDPKSHPSRRRKPSGLKGGQAATKNTVWNRYERLKKGEVPFRMTLEESTFLAAIVRFLDGRDRTFKKDPNV